MTDNAENHHLFAVEPLQIIVPIRYQIVYQPCEKIDIRVQSGQRFIHAQSPVSATNRVSFCPSFGYVMVQVLWPTQETVGKLFR